MKSLPIHFAHQKTQQFASQFSFAIHLILLRYVSILIPIWWTRFLQADHGILCGYWYRGSTDIDEFVFSLKELHQSD